MVLWGLLRARLSALALLCCATAAIPPRTTRVDPACAATGDCTEAFGAALRSCRGGGADAPPCRVWLQRNHTYPLVCGAARFSTAAVVIEGLHDLLLATEPAAAARAVAAHGASSDAAVLLLTYSPTPCTAIAALHSSSVTISDLRIDVLRPPFTFGRVLRKSATSFDLAVDSDPLYRHEIKTISNSPWLLGANTLYPFDSASWRVSDDPALSYSFVATDYYARPMTGIVAVTYPAKGVMRVPLGAGGFPSRGAVVGQPYVVRHLTYESRAVQGFNVSGLTIAGVSVHGGEGMGFRCDFCSGATVLNRTAITSTPPPSRPGPRRPMSITADCHHFISCAGSVQVLDSLCEAQGDDGLNVHSNYVTATTGTTSGSAAGAVSQLGYEEWPGGAVPGQGYINPPYYNQTVPHLVGETLRFWDARSLQVKGEALLLAAEPADLATVRWLSLRRPLAAGDFFLSTARAPRVQVIGSVYRNNRGRGLVLFSNNILITHNNISHTSSAGVELYSGNCVSGTFTEGPFAYKVSIVNNRLVGAAAVRAGRTLGMVEINACVATAGPDGLPLPHAPPRPLSKGQVYSDVRIAGNEFVYDSAFTPVPAVHATATDGLVVESNSVAVASSAAKAPAVDVCVFGNAEQRVASNRCAARSGGVCVVSPNCTA